MSRDTFLEMQPVTADALPGLTHVHMVTDDLNATIARLRQAGLPAAGAHRDDPQHHHRAWRRAAQQREEREHF